jgi:hypothetical protein
VKARCLLVSVALLAAATSAIAQSSGKVTPAAVTITTKPAKLVGAYPWKVRTYGKVRKPRQNCPPGQGSNNPYCSSLANGAVCRGKVRVTYKLGRKIVARRTTKLTSDCSYSARSTIRNRSLAGKRVRVQARFLGNRAMNPRSSKRRRLLFARHAKGL